MDKQPVDKAYISPIDRFIHEFNASRPLSASQQKEVEKHRRIAELRDKPEASSKEDVSLLMDSDSEL